MGHDPVDSRAVGGMYRPHPTGLDIPIGKAGEVECLLLAVLSFGRDTAALRFDPDHAGNITVVAFRATIVACKLDAPVGVQLLLVVDECLGLVVIPLRGRPPNRLVLHGFWKIERASRVNIEAFRKTTIYAWIRQVLG